jgi:hypothetical protein
MSSQGCNVSNGQKYTVDCYTKETWETTPGFPENSYDADTTEEVAKILHNCTRKDSGISTVQIWINQPDDREPIES